MAPSDGLVSSWRNIKNNPSPPECQFCLPVRNQWCIEMHTDARLLHSFEVLGMFSIRTAGYHMRASVVISIQTRKFS